MKTETLTDFHGNGITSLHFPTPAHSYKRILLLPSKCYFHVRELKSVWADAYHRVLKSQGIVLLKVHQPENMQAVIQNLIAHLPIEQCQHCLEESSKTEHSSELHACQKSKEGLKPYTLLAAPFNQQELFNVVLSDGREIIKQLSGESFHVLSETILQINSCGEDNELVSQEIQIVNEQGEICFHPNVLGSVSAQSELEVEIELGDDPSFDDFDEHDAIASAIALQNALNELRGLIKSVDNCQHTFLRPGVVMLMDNRRFLHAVA